MKFRIRHYIHALIDARDDAEAYERVMQQLAADWFMTSKHLRSVILILDSERPPKHRCRTRLLRQLQRRDWM
jgi:hypothetical protein